MKYLFKAQFPVLLPVDIDRIVEEEPAEGSTTSGAVNIAQLGPNLDRLWAYTCNLTKGRNVSCMSWNNHNKVSMTCNNVQLLIL